ncbi:OpgC domain-containing protein, partial [Nostoc sp. NIES-2111]
MADGGRNVVVDFWRGFALVSIFVNHVPGNLLEPYTHKNYGLSDASELFVLLAGVAVSLAYGRPGAPAFGLAGMIRIGARIRTLYMAHITMLVIAASIVSVAVMTTEDVRILEATQFDLVMASPLTAVIGIATLGLQPAYFNILPLYIVLLMLAPLLLMLAASDRRIALAASAFLYALTQAFELRPPSYPGDDQWFFNPFAWQLLFTTGLCLGRPVTISPALHRVLLPAALAVLAMGALIAQLGLYGTFDLSPLPRTLWDMDKTNLSLPRLLHVLALVYCVSRLPVGRWLAGASWTGAVTAMGRHSLPVFCVGSVLSLAITLARPSLQAGWAGDLALIGAGLVLQGTLALVLEWNRRGQTAARAAVCPRLFHSSTSASVP